jgi:hypothetical protein
MPSLLLILHAMPSPRCDKNGGTLGGGDLGLAVSMMAGVRATQAERMAQDKMVLLAVTQGDAAEMIQRVSAA